MPTYSSTSQKVRGIARAQHTTASALCDIVLKKFDLILMDISLPDADGRDVCRELRNNSRTQKTRIVALTGHAELKGSSCMSDFDDCIVKPITMKALESLLSTTMPIPE